MTDEKETKPVDAASAPDAEAKAEAKVEKKEEAKKEKPKKKKDPADAFRLAPNHPVANAWKTFAGAGIIGIGAAGVGYYQNQTRFAYAWLFGFICALTLAVGSMMFVMMHHITNGNWGVVVRRVAEVFGASSWVLAILFVPIFLMRTTLFAEWLPRADASRAHAMVTPVIDAHDYELAANDFQPGRLNPHGLRMPPPSGTQRPSATGLPIQHMQPSHAAEERAEHVEHDEVMKAKAWYLSLPFFTGRCIAYFIIWSLLGLTLLRWSSNQDKTKDLSLTVRLGRFSAPGIVLLVLSLTFAAFDWIMVLDPTWYSTIFGVTFFAGSMVCVFATLILTFLGFRDAGVLVKEVTVEHYHDLGKLLFGFMCFWAYVCFSQFMLIWYASIPEELTFYHHRWDVGWWKTVSLAIVWLHFIIPFVGIMSRNVKRNLNLLRYGAWLLLAMHVVDMYWLVMPNVPHQGSFGFNWVDAAGFAGPVGVFLAVAFRRLASYPLVPIGNPRLQRSLQFLNA